jgi:lipid-binding SYLF domain-containing protein
MLPLLAQSSNFDEHNKRVRESTLVLEEIMSAGDKGIPHDLLQKAQCVGIVPNLKRAGFVIGGQYGKGVLTCRVPDRVGWSAVSTVRVEGGSIGLQIGAGETDLVFIVMNQSGMNRLMSDKFTIGGDASVMAGPLGRSADARTDAFMKAEILAYSRSRGVFGGISLEGATLRPDNDDNAKLYGGPVTQEKILHGHVKPTADMTGLFDELNRWAPFKKT